MTTPEYVPDPFLCAEDDAVAEAIRISNARDDKVTRDTCQRCGGQGCDQCIDPRDQHVPEYVRSSIKRWRPAS